MRGNIYRQNHNRIEIEICTVCNLRCLQCDRSSAQAPSNDCMSLEQVLQFVKESITSRWLWYEIEILGGEPTLHPNLHDILEVLQAYLAFNPDCRVIVVTNGHGSSVKKVLDGIPSWVKIENTEKRVPNQIPFNPFNIAPIDLIKYRNDRFIRGCRIVSECGLGLNRSGYYICGPAASVDRVFGFNVGIKSLSMLTERRLHQQRRTLCQYCGHFCGIQYQVRKQTEMSASWVDAYRRYRVKRPQLSAYGASQADHKAIGARP